MKSSRIRLPISIGLLLTTLGCAIGVQPPSANPVDAVATVVAMTMQAYSTATSPAAPTASASPVVATATTKPMLRINTNNATCRSGPSQDSTKIASFAGGTNVDMIAKDTADGYWLVKDPASGSSCWVQVQDATPSGSFDLLPEVTPQPTIGRNVPAKPGSSSSFNYWSYDCAARTVTLRWIDAADNETGYHIYRLGKLVADLPAGSTTYSEALNVEGGSLSYSITAYNDAGESAPLTTPSFSC